MRGPRRLAALLAATAVALAAGALASLAPGSPLMSSCAGAGSQHAALVVEHGDGSVVTRCVSFGTGTVTGEQLLDSSGVAWSGQTFGSFGDAVCAMDAEPAHYTTCPGKDSYWAVFVSRGGGAWQLSSIGISSLTLADGDAEGFRYVPAVGAPAPPPSPAGACAAAAGSAAPTATGATPAVATPVRSGVGATAGATGTAAAQQSEAQPSATAQPTPATTAQAADASLLAIAGVSAAASPSPGAASQAPTQSPGSGLDPGLLLAALAGGGLAGLALIRLAASGRRAT